MKIVKRSIETLTHDPANARKHNSRNLDAIRASLNRFGQQKPIVIDSSGVVRAGNGTLEAAKSLGWKEIDCVVTGLQGSDATAYAIADNRTSELAEWDDDVLAATLESLRDEDAALLEGAGYSDGELAALIKAFDVEADGMPSLKSGDRDPFQQMTFTLHDSQVEIVKGAIEAAKKAGDFSGPNENSNGNALARICEAYRG